MKIRFAFKAGTIAAFVMIRLIGTTPAASAQTPGSFATTGRMTEPREFHTATLLNDGRVLLAGGYSRSAELYDPATGTFTATGSLRLPRAQHTATLLPDGRVLIAAGNAPVCANKDPNCFDRTIAAEIYDPSTGTFAATGNMLIATPCASAALLNNGNVFIAGGSDFTNPPGPGSAEIYDPETGAFTSAGTYATPLLEPVADYFCPSANRLPDGKVLITWNTGDAELYDPVSSSFSGTGRMVAMPYEGSTDPGQSTTLLASGHVLFAGGSAFWSSLSAAETYDAYSGRFSAAGDMTESRDGHTATLLPDGTVLIVGGKCFSVPKVCQYGVSLTSSEIYDPSKAIFAGTGSMFEPRQWHTATLLNDGRVLITGGSTQYQSLNTAELYTPTSLVPAPVLYSASGIGPKQGAILHANTPRLATPADPAAPGEALEIYGTGLMDDGVVPPQVSVGGRLAEVLYFGNAPGFPALKQIDVRVPFGVAPGPAVPVHLNYLNRPSNEVTIAVR